MPIYLKPSKEEVYDLINSANAAVPNWIPVTPTNCRLGVPAAGTVPGDGTKNTKITVSAVQSSPDFIGKQTVFYRRRDLATLCRGVLIQTARWSPTMSAAGSVVFTVYQLLPIINAKYGLNLTQDDVNDLNILRGNTLENGSYTTTVTVTTKATSLGYIGSFQLKWIADKRDIGSMITVTDLPGRLFPGGNVFDGAHRPILTSAFFGIDFSDIYATSPWFASFTDIRGTPYDQTRTFINACFARVNQVCGTTFPMLTDYAYNNPWGCEAVTLPSAKFPEANSQYYNSLFTFELTDPLVIAQYGPGRVYIHFNI